MYCFIILYLLPIVADILCNMEHALLTFLHTYRIKTAVRRGIAEVYTGSSQQYMRMYICMYVRILVYYTNSLDNKSIQIYVCMYTYLFCILPLRMYVLLCSSVWHQECLLEISCSTYFERHKMTVTVYVCDDCVCLWWLCVLVMTVCVCDGSVCLWWLCVFVMTVCVCDDCVCLWWQRVFVMTACVCDDSVYLWWLRVFVMTACVCDDCVCLLWLCMF